MQTFDEFLTQERDRLLRFSRWWLEHRKAQPDHYPVRMEESDWDEALMTFSE